MGTTLRKFHCLNTCMLTCTYNIDLSEVIDFIEHIKALIADGYLSVADFNANQQTFCDTINEMIRNAPVKAVV